MTRKTSVVYAALAVLLALPATSSAGEALRLEPGLWLYRMKMHLTSGLHKGAKRSYTKRICNPHAGALFKAIDRGSRKLRCPVFESTRFGHGTRVRSTCYGLVAYGVRAEMHWVGTAVASKRGTHLVHRGTEITQFTGQYAHQSPTHVAYTITGDRIGDCRDNDTK